MGGTRKGNKENKYKRREEGGLKRDEGKEKGEKKAVSVSGRIKTQGEGEEEEKGRRRKGSILPPANLLFTWPRDNDLNGDQTEGRVFIV